MSDSIIDNAVSLLRKTANRNTFIASSFFTAFICQPGGSSWHRIGQFFQHQIAYNRGDGLYIIPSFYGGDNFGHYYVLLIHIENGEARGFSMDSLGTSYNDKKSLIKHHIMVGFDIFSNRHWQDIPILLQTELECGARCIWNMTLIVEAYKKHFLLHQIFEKIKTMGNISRAESAKIAREDVFDIISTQSGSTLFHKIFPPSPPE